MNSQELADREKVVVEREALLAERDNLEARKIRCSHSFARDIVQLSQHINSLEDSIRLRQGEGRRGGEGGVAQSSGTGGDRKEEIARLVRERLVNYLCQNGHILVVKQCWSACMLFPLSLSLSLTCQI